MPFPDPVPETTDHLLDRPAHAGQVDRGFHGAIAARSPAVHELPGTADVHSDPPERVLSALRHAHARGARILSICSGASVLAATGLLDGQSATTHWRYAGLPRSRFPRIQVDARVLYVDNGQLITSAGTAAGIDACLHIVRRDHGADVANRVARRMVVAPHRDGGQAQFIEQPVAPAFHGGGGQQPGALAERPSAGTSTGSWA